MYELFNKYDKTSLGTVDTLSAKELIEHFNAQFEGTESFKVLFINDSQGSVASENGPIDFTIEEKGNGVLADVNGSSIDEKLSDALFAEYNKAYSNTKAGQIYPQWFTSEQLKWIDTVFKNCR